MDVDARVAALEAENERQRDKIEELERLLHMDRDSWARFPVEWLLTGSEAKLLAFLASRDSASKEAIMLALYSERPDEAPEIKIVDVFICKLRKKLRPFGIEIDTVWSFGYKLSAAGRAVLGSVLKLEAA